ncbi:MAG: ABC transporter ATP-binding protein [Alphaproteobacteria bacterium]|nr:ABC transporter ATP-binding protein [Alphaproteobacteria bacterium]
MITEPQDPPAPEPPVAGPGDLAHGPPLVRLDGVRREFDGRVVLDIPDWTVATGGHCLVLGPSGSGKTTLLNIIAGLLRPTAGTVTISGQDIGTLGPGALDVFRGRHIGIVFQTLHLVSALSVADNLHLARYLAGLRRDEARLHGVLESLGIGAMAAARPRTLSQGEAQRVAIARAVINDPKIILADEPTSALDDGNATQVLNLLSQHADMCGATLVIATHDRRIRDRFDAVLELGGPP